MFLYLGIFFGSAYFAGMLRNRQVSWMLAIFFGVFLALLAGTRYYVGCDYTGYLLRFAYAGNWTSWSTLLLREEPGFNGLVLAIKEAGLTYDALILVVSSIYVVCLMRFASLARAPAAFLVLAFPVLIVQLGMSGMRQALALGFLMLALVSFAHRARVPTAIWVLVAAQFHASAIIFLPIAMLVGRHLSTIRILVALMVLGPVVVFLLQSQFEVYSDRYIEQIYGENSSSGAWYRYALVLLPFVMLARWYRKVEVRFPQTIELMRLFMLISFVMAPIGLVSSVVLHRLVFYVMPVSIITLLAVAETLAVTWRAPAIRLAPFVVYGSYVLVWFTFSRHASSCYVPYQSWLW